MRISDKNIATTRLLSMAALLVPMAIGGCYSGVDTGGDKDSAGADTDGGPGLDPTDGEPGSAPLDGPEECVDTKTFFEEEVARPILQAKCFACHNPQGAANTTDFILQGDDYPGYLEVNYNTLENISRLEIDGKPLLLRKPTMDGVTHGGGVKFEIDSAEYEAMTEMIDLFKSPVHCVSDKDIDAFFQGIVDADEQETLRKAVFLLGSRYPTPEEIDAVEAGGMDAVEQVLDAVMQEEAFYVRIKEIYNDQLHTDRYLPGTDALDVLSSDENGEQLYPGAAAWDDGAGGVTDPEARDAANDAVAREPLNIIENVLRKGAPFTEIITGDYTMLNPPAARAYGLDPSALGFTDPNSLDELIEYNFEEWPQAGILSTPVYNNRYPNTPTNRNRARSRYAFQFFGGEDVQRLAARPIDVNAVQATNPTLFDAACVVCHDYIDPVAGAFQNYDYGGLYRPLVEGEAWYGDMVPPGFKGEDIPVDQAPLPWLANELAHDNKFSLSVISTLYKGLTGNDPLLQPLDSSDPHYLAKVRAYEAQDYTFQDLAQRFQNSNYDLRVLIKEMVKTPWFRAIDVQDEMNEERVIELSTMGSARVLPPEALDRRIVATVGFQWVRNGVPALLTAENYKFFFGGIDSINVTTRLTELNAVMNNIADRMANEVACQATAFDLSRPTQERLLFPYVEAGDTNEQAIKDNIAYLHEHILGERLDDDDPELERTYYVFKSVLQDGQQGLETGEYGTGLPGTCAATTDRITGEAMSGIVDDPDYTVRAWQATVTYLLTDYRFLFE